MIAMRKAAFVLSLVFMLCFGLSGCAQQKEANPSPSPSAAQLASNVIQREDLVVEDYGFSTDQFGITHYGVIVSNPNETYAANQFNVTVTAKDAEGKVLGTDTAHPRYLLPLQTSATAGSINTSGNPASIEVSISIQSSSWELSTDVQGGDLDELFYAGNISEIDKGYGQMSITGEVFNGTEKDTSNPIVNVILRDVDGSIVYGDFTYVQGDVPAGGSAAFEVYGYNLPEHATAEAYTMMYF